MSKSMRRPGVLGAVTLALLAAGEWHDAAASGSYTWAGPDGGNWNASSSWVDSLGNPATASPGPTDFAQFVGVSVRVTGAPAAQVADFGPGTAVTLDGSGSFFSVNVGQDLSFNVGDASLTIAAGQTIASTLFGLGSAAGGSGTLTANGVLSVIGGLTMDQAGQPSTIIVNSGGAVYDGVSLTMAAGGLIQLGGRMVIGNATGGGADGALTILGGYAFNGEGTIAGNVIVNGTLQTFNAGWPANKLVVTGDLTGTGSVQVVQELDLGGAVGAGVTIGLYANGGSNAGLLRLAHPLADAGKLGTMATGSIIALSGLSFDAATWAPDGLTVSGASGTLILPTTGDHSFQSFTTHPDAISGTDIVVGLAAVPEPASASMLLAGLAGLVGWRARRRSGSLRA